MKTNYFRSARSIFGVAVLGLLLFVSANSFGLAGCHWECWDTHSPIGWQCAWVCG